MKLNELLNLQLRITFFFCISRKKSWLFGFVHFLRMKINILQLKLDFLREKHLLMGIHFLNNKHCGKTDTL